MYNLTNKQSERMMRSYILINELFDKTNDKIRWENKR
jgi:hypothetical protein